MEIQDYANEFCIEAQLKLGKLLEDMDKNEGAAHKGWKEERPTKTEGRLEDTPPTYSGLGIDRRTQAAGKGGIMCYEVKAIPSCSLPVLNKLNE